MKNTFITLLFFIGFIFSIKAQIKYSGKIETGYLKYGFRSIRVDPGPSWKGYNLNEKQNGIDLNFINGITFLKENVFLGIGLGYMNFEGINGISVFSHLEFIPFKTKLSPLLYTKIGFDHIWNQYDGGKGTGLTEFGLGINYNLNKNFNLSVKSGLLFTQQSLLIPLRIGFGF